MTLLHTRHEEITRHVKDDDLHHATARLQDFARDFAGAPDRVTEAVALRRRFNLLRAAGPGADVSAGRAAISAALLDCAGRIAASAADAPAVYPLTDLVCVTQGIEKTYARASAFRLRGIDINLRFGEITAVVGENGNGKSTLIKLVVGALLPTAGVITYPYFGAAAPGDRIDPYELRRRIAYIPQELPRWNGSVRENLAFTAAAHGLKPGYALAEVEFAISRLGLDSYADAARHELSGGYRMRFALAQALVINPHLLVLDEPLANLDINTQLIFLRDLRNLASSLTRPLSVLVSSQHLHEIESVADRLLFIKDGRAIYNGSRAAYGSDRSENVFECSCDASRERLAEVLAPLAPARIDPVGSNVIIAVPMQVDVDLFLSTLLKHQIRISYFRDISQSTRRLFDTEAV